jgi:hypothetical protein
MKSAKNKHGGRRRFAGRKRLTDGKPYPVSLSITHELLAELDDLAESMGKSRSELARQLIRSGITDLTHAG